MDERIGVNSSSQLAKPTEMSGPWTVMEQQSPREHNEGGYYSSWAQISLGGGCFVPPCRVAANDFRKDLYTFLKGQQVTCL